MPEPLLMTVAGVALAEGVKFLYSQASEVLRSWRARRRDKSNVVPKVLDAPEGVTVGDADPLPEPRDAAMEDTLAELRDLADEVRSGSINVYSPEGRQVAAQLRDYLEVIMRAPITFAGEDPRIFEAGRVDVVVQKVEGDVAGVRARGGGAASLGDVRVQTGDVAGTGRVSGVELS
jgi:hypothetical protein